METLKIILIIIGAYLFGSIAWAFIIGKLNGIDIREHGSGNTGATNITRTLGKPWGLTCFFIDFLKGFLPVLLMLNYIGSLISFSELCLNTLIILVIFAVLLGHMYPIFLKFKGGKGVATGTGALVAITPYGILAGIIVWLITFFSFRYVSLASITAAIVVPLVTYFVSIYNLYETPHVFQALIVVISIAALYTHRANIKRLLNGTEDKFYKNNKKD